VEALTRHSLDKATMRDFDTRHLIVPANIEPAQIKQLREANNVSQPVFARYLNTSESTVEKWETGAKGRAAWRLNY
jgi:putative transcriptional regulator